MIYAKPDGTPAISEMASLIRALDSESAIRGRLELENKALRAELDKAVASLDHAVAENRRQLAEIGRLVAERAQMLEQVDAVLARSIELEEKAASVLQLARGLIGEHRSRCALD